MKQRVQKLLAAAGVDSRRHIEQMILQGRVSVNGKTMTRLPILVDPMKDEVEVDGEKISLKKAVAERTVSGWGPSREKWNRNNTGGGNDALGTGPVERKGNETAAQHEERAAALAAKGMKLRTTAGEGGRYYLMLNKPRGVYSTNLAQGAQLRAIDLLPPNFPARVYPVGRLDAESRGLLLLTNDGELTNLLTHPRFGVPKTYRATIDGFVPPEHMTMLEQGLYLIDKGTGRGMKTGRAILKIHSRTRSRTIVDITLKEGKNRQIRRMLARLGHKVRDLNRIQFGPLGLEGIAVGAVRPLTVAELKSLRESARKSKAFFEKHSGAGEAEEAAGPRGAAKGPGGKGGPKRVKAGGRGARAGETPKVEVDESMDFVPGDEGDD